MSSDEREALRLQDIVDNIDRIESYLAGCDFDAFARDDKTIDAVERCLQRLTEAVIRIGPERMPKSRRERRSMRCAGSAIGCATNTIVSTCRRSGARHARVCRSCARIACGRWGESCRGIGAVPGIPADLVHCHRNSTRPHPAPRNGPAVARDRRRSPPRRRTSAAARCRAG